MAGIGIGADVSTPLSSDWENASVHGLVAGAFIISSEQKSRPVGRLCVNFGNSGLLFPDLNRPNCQLLLAEERNKDNNQEGKEGGEGHHGRPDIGRDFMGTYEDALL